MSSALPACPALWLCRARCRQGASCGAPDLAGTLLHLLQSSTAPQPRARSIRPEGWLPGAARAGGTGEGRGRNEPDRWAGCQVLGAKWSGRLASPPVCRVNPVRHLHDLPTAPEDLGDLARMKTAAGIDGLECLACPSPCSRDEGAGSIIHRSGRRVSGNGRVGAVLPSGGGAGGREEAKWGSRRLWIYLGTQAGQLAPAGGIWSPSWASIRRCFIPLRQN